MKTANDDDDGTKLISCHCAGSGGERSLPARAAIGLTVTLSVSMSVRVRV